MKLTQGVQESLITLLCYDADPQGGTLVRNLIPLECYDPYFRNLAEEAHAYIDKHRAPPGEHTLDLVDKLKVTRPDDAKIYDELFLSIQESREAIRRDFVVGQAQAFARAQQIRTGVGELIECLKADDEAAINQAEAVIARMREPAVMELADLGTDLWDTSRSLRFLDRDRNVSLATGIPELDRHDLGPQRKNLHLLIGPLKGGKSWWLHHLGKMALMQRWKTVHVSLENSEELGLMRYFQTFFSLGKREARHEYLRISGNGDGRPPEFVEETIERPAIYDVDGRERIMELVARRTGKSPLRIKEFPTGKLTLRELEAYLDALAARSFLPDLLLVDYADLMHIPGRDPVRELAELYKGLRGIAVERDLAVATVSQASKAGARSKTVDVYDAADNTGKGAIADTTITYSRTPAEKSLGLARLSAGASRNDADGFEVMISQAYGIGQFCMSSHRMVGSYFADVARLQDDDELEEEGDEDKR